MSIFDHAGTASEGEADNGQKARPQQELKSFAAEMEKNHVQAKEDPCLALLLQMSKLESQVETPHEMCKSSSARSLLSRGQGERG